MPLSVCLLASEVTPLAKTGGLADVAGALAKFLHGAGHDARLFMPAYASIDRTRIGARLVPGLEDVALNFATHSYRYAVLEGRLPGSGAPLYLIDCPVLFARSRLYTNDVDEHLRFIAFTRAALETCQRLRWGTTDPALQRLAHGLRPAVPQIRVCLGSPVREHTQRDDDSQHRLSGPVRSGCRG